MIEREYYSLDVAARRMNCTVDDVIHMAASEKIRLVVLTYGLPATRIMAEGFPLTGQREAIKDRYCFVEPDKVALLETARHSFNNANLFSTCLSYVPCCDDSGDYWDIAFTKNHIEMTFQTLFVLAKSIKPFELSAEQKQGHQAEYLDTTHPMHSKELAIAIETWNAVLLENPDRPKTGSRKKMIEDYLRSNHRLDNSEISRISKMLNPDKNGGAPKSE